MNLNRAMVCGRLTADPEFNALPSGATVTSFTIATNRRYTQNGEQKELSEFHRIVVFGKQGDACATFLRKGSTALVEGRLQTRSWETDGIRHYRTEILADHVEFGDRGKSEPGEARQVKEVPQPVDDVPTVKYPEEEIRPEDIPFS